MALRCLLFSSTKETIQPIWGVLADLGIEGEYCQSPVDAVEKVTTQLFQIVITDWDDQPEAGFLIRTARDLKASQRPITLAIVGDNAHLPEALQAGANSVLLKPIRAEQVRDTMSTACELLRAKHSSAVPPVAAATPGQPESPTVAPPSVSQAPEKIRAGEFLHSPGSAPGGQFEAEGEGQSTEVEEAQEVDPLTELEPMAASVAAAPHRQTAARQALRTWSDLQTRLAQPAVRPAENASAKTGLLSYADISSRDSSPQPAEVSRSEREAQSEANLFAYMSGGLDENADPAKLGTGRGKLFLAAALIVACTAPVALPQVRQRARTLYRHAVLLGGNWLNPPPVPVPQVAPQHESFGQAGEEYKLPVAENIPDATTDPSQIRVLPVIDPTAKPVKSADSNGGPPSTRADGIPSDQVQSSVTKADQPEGEYQAKDLTPSSVGQTPGGTTDVSTNTPGVQAMAPHTPVRPTVSSPGAIRIASAGTAAGIPTSLKSHVASTVPAFSGAKPLEAAMSSIEPVSLPESAAWDLLLQPVNPPYPEAAKAGGQRGTVVLEVLIGRDGTVEDAKFFQGSLVFARAAIDAVKQWRFKPYTLNGRVVSVHSVITLNFKPPA